MKDCFAFSKKSFEKIKVAIRNYPSEGIKLLLDYIEYGLYNRIPEDISINEVIFLQKSFLRRDISSAERVGRDDLLSNVCLRLLESELSSYKEEPPADDLVKDSEEGRGTDLNLTEEQRESLKRLGLEL